MTISIIGTGYVGLVTGAVFADLGHKVYCVDIDQNKIDTLSQGKIPFYEPGLAEIVKYNLDHKRLHFTTNYSTAIPKSKAVFICVGTPPGLNGECNTSYLFAAVEETAKHLKGYTLIVIKSTVPIGIDEKLNEIIKKYSKCQYEFASCPEFLKEGSALEDAKNPDRVVIGSDSNKGTKLLLELYKPFNGEKLICDLKSAQLIKYASNTFLATKISFANAIANLSERLGANALTVLEGMGLDARIGKAFLKPGIGFGGSCFPKDTLAFIDIANKVNYKFSILEAVDQINHLQVDLFYEKVVKQLGQVQGKTLAVLGLSFKPNTDDIRESQAIKIIQKLLAAGAKIKSYDPAAMGNTEHLLGNHQITYEKDPYIAAKDTSALLILTEWDEFKELDLSKIHKMMEKAVIIDGRNIYDPEKAKSLGFIYQGIGRN